MEEIRETPTTYPKEKKTLHYDGHAGDSEKASQKAWKILKPSSLGSGHDGSPMGCKNGRD
jgi:hypothetical protein